MWLVQRGNDQRRCYPEQPAPSSPEPDATLVHGKSWDHFRTTVCTRMNNPHVGTPSAPLHSRTDLDRRQTHFLGVKGSPVQIRPSRQFFEHLYPELGTKLP